ncbi:MAG: hypothetical protein ACI8UO_000783 [Verrucomicrobiales bacterium]|jgi:hypothetical protein
MKSALVSQLIRWSVRLNLPALTAVLLWKCTRLLGSKAPEKRILCVQRSIFEDDVKAVAQVDSKFQFALLPKSRLNDIMEVFLQKDPQFIDLTEFNYHHGCCEKSLLRYRAYLDKVIGHFQKRWPPDALFSGNFGYKQQQELAKVFEARGIPIVILFKEGLVLPEHLDKMREALVDRKRFLGNKILFYSEQIQDAILKSDAFENCEFETAVTGIPRLDRLAHAPKSTEKHLVFYSFYPEDKFRFFGLNEQIYKEVCEKGRQFHLEILRFAERNSDWHVTIKTKANAKYFNFVRDLIDARSSTLQNVRLTSNDNAAELLLDSSAIATFASTTGLEALVAERLVISPDFGEFFGDEPWDYFRDYPDLVCYAASAEDIEEALKQPAATASEKGNSRRDEFLLKIINGADGKAGARVLSEIASCIDQRFQNAG